MTLQCLTWSYHKVSDMALPRLSHVWHDSTMADMALPSLSHVWHSWGYSAWYGQAMSQCPMSDMNLQCLTWPYQCGPMLDMTCSAWPDRPTKDVPWLDSGWHDHTIAAPCLTWIYSVWYDHNSAGLTRVFAVSCVRPFARPLWQSDIPKIPLCLHIRIFRRRVW